MFNRFWINPNRARQRLHGNQSNRYGRRHQRRISTARFDRFRQADTSSIRKFGGLGLGLAIVRHITEMHGGTVLVGSSGENKGSTFIVRLPIMPAAHDGTDSHETNGNFAVEPVEPVEPIEKFKLDGLLILVVDDEIDTRQLLVRALTFHGATIETAGAAALYQPVIKTTFQNRLTSTNWQPSSPV